MDVHVWSTPIQAEWQKSNTLVGIGFSPDTLNILLLEDQTGQRWNLAFKDPAAFKMIAGESATWSLEPLPPDGGFFQITDSPWLKALGLSESRTQRSATHYVVCCKRELIEVAAFNVAVTPE